MGKSCCAAAGTPAVRYAPVAFALAALLAMGSPADAASIGHSRLVSAPGQPLRVDIPIRDLTEAEQQSLRVVAAPLSSWQQAGLTPPVELSTLQISVQPGFSADSRVIQVRSSQEFTGVVADLLLQISTSAGSQQHQVSLLAGISQAASIGGQSVSGVSGTSGVTVGAQSSRGAISVRRGDTLFALARANAVEGVTVYQMMIALQKANPQAFIEGNINLVKAGATLAIPDAASLRAISDREARRIFQQHAQAFAAYRQRIASGQRAAVSGGAAQSGTVVASTSGISPQPAPASGEDQVVLSSGAASSGATIDPDAQADERQATQRNIDESQARVSQLERNVQSLNQALQMQGEAAKEAVVEGAAVVGQTLSEAAASIGLSSDEPGASTGAAQSGQAREGNLNPLGAAGQAATTEGQVATTEGQAAGIGAQSQQSSQTPSEASGATASTPGDISSADAARAAANVANRSDSDANDAAASTGSGSGVALSVPGSASTPQTNESNPSISSKAEQPVSWIQQNLLGVITAILALVVLIIAWVLRRASASRGEGQGVVTEAMVQERLEQIDLDLSNPPSDTRPPKAG